MLPSKGKLKKGEKGENGPSVVETTNGSHDECVVSRLTFVVVDC